MTAADLAERHDLAADYARFKGEAADEASAFATFATTDAARMPVAMAYGAWTRIREVTA